MSGMYGGRGKAAAGITGPCWVDKAKVAGGVDNVPVGATQNLTLAFTVLSGSQTPPNGSLITLVVADLTHGATVSRSVAVNQTLAMLHQPTLFRGELAWAAPAAKTGSIPNLWLRR